MIRKRRGLWRVAVGIETTFDEGGCRGHRRDVELSLRLERSKNKCEGKGDGGWMTRCQGDVIGREGGGWFP